MEHIKSINNLNFCNAGNCGKCYSTCQSQYKDSSGMATHECENEERFNSKVITADKEEENFN